MGYTRKQPKNFSITPLRPKVKKKILTPRTTNLVHLKKTQ